MNAIALTDPEYFTLAAMHPREWRGIDVIELDPWLRAIIALQRVRRAI